MLSSDFVLGKKVIEFEQKISEYVGSKFAVGVANGSDALMLAILAKNLPEKSHILVAANTYFAAASAIMHAGFTPRFFDVQLDTRLPSRQDIETNLNLECSLIIKSHLFGEADITDLQKLDRIHDCSQAHGTFIGDRHIGSGETCTFSFYPGKNLGAFGDAGLITTNSRSEYQCLIKLRNQGTSGDRYVHEINGFNSRLDSIQAGVLLFKLLKLNLNNSKRIKLAQRYNSNLINESPLIKLFSSPKKIISSYHLYQVYVDIEDLNLLQTRLLNKGITSGRHYPIPLPLQPAFKSLGYAKGDFPNSELLAKKSLSLPIFPDMTFSQVDYVCESLIEILNDL